MHWRRTRDKLGNKSGLGSHAVQMPKISHILAPTGFLYHHAESTNGCIHTLTCCEDGAISSNLFLPPLISGHLKMEPYKAGHSLQPFQISFESWRFNLLRQLEDLERYFSGQLIQSKGCARQRSGPE